MSFLCGLQIVRLFPFVQVHKALFQTDSFLKIGAHLFQQKMQRFFFFLLNKGVGLRALRWIEYDG